MWHVSTPGAASSPSSGSPRSSDSLIAYFSAGPGFPLGAFLHWKVREGRGEEHPLSFWCAAEKTVKMAEAAEYEMEKIVEMAEAAEPD